MSLKRFQNKPTGGRVLPPFCIILNFNRMKKLINKKTNEAFGKQIFLLGRDKEGTNYWLEKAQFSCGWYWGFGYVETYTNNKNPHLSKDIQSHSHIDSSFMGSMEKYDSEKQCFVKAEYVHNIFDAPILVETTFTESEGWTLSELFKSFYHLKQSAELFHRGSSNLTTNPCSELIKNEEWEKQINHEILPLLFEKIYTILTPSK
jgi:hypothetical protein